MIFYEALAWIFDGSHWPGIGGRDNNPAIFQRLGETLQVSSISVLIAVAIALPLGVLIGHTGRGRGGAIVVSNIARAIPTLGLLSVLVLALTFNAIPVVIVLVILGIPPMLAGAYAGVESVNKGTVDAARAIGMTEWQIVTKVELPLAANLLVGGVRATALQIVATATIASALGFGGLGLYISSGLVQNDFVQLVAGAILVTALCLLLDGLLSIVQRLVAPRGLPRDQMDSASPKRRSRGARLVTTTGSQPLQEGTQS